MIFSNCNWGYEGSLVNVEVDLRRGIPAVDIVGLADNAVKESRERVQAAIRNSGFEFPPERVLISLSPADIRKDGAQFDLPIALAILDKSLNLNKDIKVIVLGELDLSGSVRPVRGVFSALENAVECGIQYAIVPMNTEALPDGIIVHKVGNLADAVDAYKSIGETIGDNGFGNAEDNYDDLEVTFTDLLKKSHLDNAGHEDAKFAMAVAAAGRHNLLFIGSPGCGKTMMIQNMPDITPNLLNKERTSVQRIWSIAGLLKPEEKIAVRPFRIPHQTASIEGICGGGPQCRPGEISLAHKGALFLDEAAEFRSSVLQMLRVPLETKTITLSRAGRVTTFPADFQLLMASNPCPCGNYGSKEKICLCSAKSIDMYWKKFSAPLLDRIEIVYDFSDETEEQKEKLTRERIRFLVERAWKRQYKRQGHLNSQMTPDEIEMYCQLTRKAQETLDKAITRYGLSPRAITNILKLTRTIHDMLDEKEQSVLDDIETALSLRKRDQFYM